MDEKRFKQFVEDFERVSASKDTLRASFSFFEINWAFIHFLSDVRTEKNSPTDSVVTIHMWAYIAPTKTFNCWTL